MAQARTPPAPSMRAAAIDRFGPPSVITVHTVPLPKPGRRQILIALHAAGVGSWDESIRDGSWRPAGRSRFPLILGTDGAGIVVATGAGVRRFRVGDRAYAYEAGNPKGGFYAEYVAVDESNAGLVPPRLGLLQAGAAAVTGLTALQGIDNALKVRKGETVAGFRSIRSGGHAGRAVREAASSPRPCDGVGASSDRSGSAPRSRCGRRRAAIRRSRTAARADTRRY